MGTLQEKEVRRVIGLNIVLLCLLFQGCATMSMTPDESYLWANNIYKYHYYLYVDQVASKTYTREEIQGFKDAPETIKFMQVDTELTQDQKDLLEEKYKILVQMSMVLAEMRKVRRLGEQPPDVQIETITRLANRLIALVGE